MKSGTKKSRILYAAMAGLLSVSTQIGCGKPPSQEPAASPAPAAHEDMMEKHACKGMNECKGKGGCKVEGKNECKGHNECKGAGGCKTA